MLYFTGWGNSDDMESAVLEVVNTSTRYWNATELEYRAGVVDLVLRVFKCFPEDMDFRVYQIYNDTGFVITPIYRAPDGSEFELNRNGYLIKIGAVRSKTAVKFVSPYGRETYVSITNTSRYSTFINRVSEIMSVPIQVARERAVKIDRMWIKSDDMVRIAKMHFPYAKVRMHRSINRSLNGLFMTIYIEMDMHEYTAKAVLEDSGLIYVEISNKGATVADMCRVSGRVLMAVAEKYSNPDGCALKLHNVTSNLAKYSRDMRISFKQNKNLTEIDLETYEKYLIEIRDILRVTLSDACGMSVVEGDDDGLQGRADVWQGVWVDKTA